MTIKLETGLVLGKLTITEDLQRRSRHGDRVWSAICECGIIIEDTACHLRKRTSCGSHICRKIRSDTNGGYAPNDASKRIPEYGIWRLIKQRCCNKNNPAFADYGGRGIFVCDEWIHNFKAFIDDMGRRPTKDHQIERIDNYGPYSKQNCKWATRFEQGCNKRNNIWMECNGKRLILAEWSRQTGLPEKMLQNRKRAGWSDNRALTTIPKSDHRRKKIILNLP